MLDPRTTMAKHTRAAGVLVGGLVVVAILVELLG